MQHLPFDKPEISTKELEAETPGHVLQRRLPFFESLTSAVKAMTEQEAAEHPLLSFLEEDVEDSSAY